MIGSTVSHYRILSKLGEGGMGTVYLAEDTKLKRQVALKFLGADLGTREARSRFAREAQAAAKLDHPNICTVYEIEDAEETVFISMALVDGVSLGERLDEGPLSVDEALDLAIQVAEGLGAAHAQGVVHRDVKPANLMLTADGRLKITDFGLAKLTDATQLTRTSSTMGTPSYMAPEQVRGEDVDARTDLWSVGVLLHEMLTGRRPFTGDSAQAVMYSIVETDPPSLHEVDPSLPRSLAWIADRCMSKDPSDRYGSAEALAADLRTVREALSSGDEATRRLEAGPRPKKAAAPSPSRTWLRRALVGLALLAASVLAYQWWQRSPSSDVQPWGDPPRAVVQDFENRTGQSQLDPLARRIRESVTEQLLASGLVEISPAMASLSGGGVDPDVVVSGAYFLEGDTVELRAKVTDARSEELVFAVPRVHASPTAPGDGISEVAQRVTGGLAVRIDNPLRNHFGGVPPTFAAFEQYRGALDALLDLQIPNFMPQLDRAIELDPRFRRPMALKAFALASRDSAATERYLAALDSLRAEMDDLDRLILDVSLATVRSDDLAMLGRAQEWHQQWPEDISGALTYMNQLFDFNRPHEAVRTYENLAIPDELRRRPWVALVNLRNVGAIYHAIGHFDGELAERQALLEAYPDNPHIHLDLAFPHAAKGNLSAVQSVISTGMALPNTGQGQLDWTTWTSCGILRSHGYPDSSRALAGWYIEQRLGTPRPGMDEFLSGAFLANNLAILLYYSGRLDDSRRLLEESVARGIQPDAARLWLTLFDATEGNRERVEEFQRSFLDPWQTEPGSGASPFLWRARYSAALGDRDESIQQLREAGARGLTLNHHSLYHIPGLEELVGYPPFEELVAPKG